jgi:hypothetical protein
MSAYDPQQTSDEPKLGAEFRLGMNGLSHGRKTNTNTNGSCPERTRSCISTILSGEANSDTSAAKAAMRRS